MGPDETDGHPCPAVCVGRSPRNSKYYKVFKYRTDLQTAGFEPVAGMPVVFGRWSDYTRLTELPARTNA